MENNTEREIQGTLKMLEDWGVLDNLEKVQKDFVIDKLVNIARASIEDYQSELNNVNKEVKNHLFTLRSSLSSEV